MRNRTYFFLSLAGLLLVSCGQNSSSSSVPDLSLSSEATSELSESGSSLSSSSSSSHKSISQAHSIFSEATKKALDGVAADYKNRALGEIGVYNLEYWSRYGELTGTLCSHCDVEKGFFYQGATGDIAEVTGDIWCYTLDNERYYVEHLIQSGNESHIWYHPSESQYQMIEDSVYASPYEASAQYFDQVIGLTTYEDGELTVSESVSADGHDIVVTFAGNITLSGKKKQAIDGGITVEDGFIRELSLQVVGAGVDYAFRYTFDQEPFELTYPDLSGYVYQEHLDPADFHEDPLEEKDFLVDFDNNRTYYQLLVYSFADSNGDGIGDFKGIADKLDYLKDLGIEGIWLSPVLRATSYHGYDTESYYEINPAYNVRIDGVDYGINYLLKEAHKRGIKILMDLVLNHTSPFHDWEVEHWEWYGDDNRFGFPELDCSKYVVRNALKDVGKYWLQRGFDGFRLDAAMWIFNSGSDRHQKNYEFWSEWCAEMKKTKPDCYLIGEVLDENHDLAYDYAAAGFDSTFDFNSLGNVINSVTNPSYPYAENTKKDVQKATKINENYILGRALSNHDIGRFNQEHPDSNDKAYYVEDVDQIKLANAINALTPGNAFIYYGDELGLKGTAEDTQPNWYYDMNYRTPMPWKDGTTKSVKYFNGFHGSGVTTSTTFSGKTAEEDALAEDSIYAALKGALQVKNANEALQKGAISSLSELPGGLNGFNVSYDGASIDVIFHSAAEVAASYSYEGNVLYTLNASADGSVATLQNNGLIVIDHSVR